MTDQQRPPADLPSQALERRPDVQLGIAPRTLDEAWRLASAIAKSALIPKAFKQHPEDVLVAIQLGIEVGLAPMQSLQSIAVINGRPTLYGDGFLALIMASPLYIDHDEYWLVGGQRLDIVTTADLEAGETAGVCTFWRRGKANPVTRSFSIADARKARTTTYDEAGNKRTVPLIDKPGPWVEYRSRMLVMRARAFAGRDCFPDVLRGLKEYGEVVDSPDEDTNETPTPAPVPRARRVSTAAAGRSQAATEAAQAPATTFRRVTPTLAVADTDQPPAADNPGTNGRPLTTVDVTDGLEPAHDKPAGVTVASVEEVPVGTGAEKYYIVQFSDELRAHTWDLSLAKKAEGAFTVSAFVKATTALTSFRKVPHKLVALEVL